MARRPRLSEKLRARARGSLYSVALLSEQGKILTGLNPRGGEPDELYLRRISRFDLDRSPDTATSSPFLRDTRDRNREAVEKIKASLEESLDRLTDSFVSLGERFLAAAEDADPERLAALAAQGAPVNYPDPRNGLTALHYVAAQGARRAFRALLKIGGVDFLARDDRGRLASEIAGAYGHNLAMERLLFRKEIQQARARGIPLEQVYQRDAAPRSGTSPSP